MTIGQRIKAARKQAGMTQEELGKKLGVSVSYVAQYETNKRNPKQETIERIAAALNVSVAYLLGKGENRTPPGRERGDFSTSLNNATENLSETDRRLVQEMARHLKDAGGGSAAVQTAGGPFYLYVYYDYADSDNAEAAQEAIEAPSAPSEGKDIPTPEPPPESP